MAQRFGIPRRLTTRPEPVVGMVSKGNCLGLLDSSESYGNETSQPLTNLGRASSNVPFILT